MNPGTAATQTLGRVVTKNYRGVTIHTYIAPEDSLFVTSQIVETSDGLVVFDAGFLTKYSEDLAGYIAGLGKPVNRIVLSHIHPDHWSGLGVLRARFSTAPIYAFPEVTAYVRANGQTILDARNAVFGGALAAKPTLPDRDLAEGTETIGAVKFEFERQPDGESDWQTVVRLPDAGVLIAFDLVFPAETHLFTVADHFDHWIALLEGIKAKASQGYDTLLIGHGEPSGFIVIDGNFAYLRKAKEIHAANKTPETYAAALKAAFPSYYGGPWVDFSSLLLYGVINP